MLCPLLLFLPLAQGPVQDAREAVPTAPVRSLLMVECAGLDALLVDPKDRALADALSLTGARLRDLPSEIDGLPVPPHVVPLLLRVFGSPFRLSVGFDPKGDPQNPAGVAIDLRLHKSDDEEAAAVQDELLGFLAGFGLGFDEAGPDGLRRAQLPFPVWIGPSDSNLVLRAGSGAGVEFHSAAELLPEGARFAYGEQYDLGAFVELLPTLMEGASPDEVEAARSLIREFGFDRISIREAVGTNREATLRVARFDGAEQFLSRAGLLLPGGLDSRMLGGIPVDATWASVGAVDLHAFFRRIIELAQEYDPGALDELREIESLIGVSVGEDVLAPLSGRFALYGSNTTGGDMTSTVLLAELDDPATMARTIETAKALFNELAAKEAKGYARIVSSEDRGLRYDTLRFPGLPVPLEPTLVLQGKALVVAANPQAARAAAEQLAGAGSSLLTDRDFQEALRGRSLDGALALSWVDTPELLSAGYGTTGALTAMISNVMRSPNHPERGPAFLLPTFHALAEGASPMVSIVRVEEGALVSRTTCDRSQLVNLAGLSGLLYRSPFGLWILANVGLQFLEQNSDLQLAWEEF